MKLVVKIGAIHFSTPSTAPDVKHLWKDKQPTNRMGKTPHWRWQIKQRHCGQLLYGDLIKPSGARVSSEWDRYFKMAPGGVLCVVPCKSDSTLGSVYPPFNSQTPELRTGELLLWRTILSLNWREKLSSLFFGIHAQPRDSISAAPRNVWIVVSTDKMKERRK